MPNGVNAVTFSDGERLSITTFRHTTDELITAYQLAKPEIDTAKRKALSEYAFKIARVYFLSLFVLYFLDSQLLGYARVLITRGKVSEQRTNFSQV
jgi:hypothetical protein